MGRLADGREIIYFDDVPGLDRSVPDPRSLPRPEPRSEVRYDPVLDDWVVIAAHRQIRTHLPTREECPLCPSRGGGTGEIPAADYHVVAFENRFPSLGGPAGGRCEVVCFTSDHHARFGALPAARLDTVMRAWTDRTRALSALPGVEYVFIFENQGAGIGATLQHPHGQIYAYPFVPATLARALESAERFRRREGGCLFCSMVAAEERAAVRVVAETERMIAFVPEAARWPFEVHVYPRRHVPDLEALDERERVELMMLYAEVLDRFDRLFDPRPPYVAHVVQAPVRRSREQAHLSLRVFTSQRAEDKLKFLAASESAAGAFINDVLPEDAARRLRDLGGTGARPRV
ncbi:galactose-1-phosphate uridylyltransferase [Thermomonospora umbrina]|uniref:Galactose-1-phosphate uridylyltransferase n=1 Tax=Thermomonospora umbrina TaxID=111806 RepID=A0A3D9SPS2_9ACTN|nr:galactose-1-phosphate uridylyltransferase [Thermomonospora umbrina]REE94935.1 UDPglucose--hexose-1-phosphate uridylyltransferase [Thermomonospora umbrina]